MVASKDPLEVVPASEDDDEDEDEDEDDLDEDEDDEDEEEDARTTSGSSLARTLLNPR